MFVVCLLHSILMDNIWTLGEDYLLLAQTMYILYE